MAFGLVFSLSDHLLSYPLLVGERMSGGSKAISDHIPSLRPDDKNVHPSGSVPLTEKRIGSLEREPSAHLLEEEMERKLDEKIEGEGEYEYDKGDKEEGEGEEEEDGKEEKEEDSEEVDEEGEEEVVAPGSSGDDYRPFILPSIWSVNDFLSKMSNRLFNNLCHYYQILDDVPIRMAGKKEKCYSGQIADVGFYKVVFMVGLRLTLKFRSVHLPYLP